MEVPKKWKDCLEPLILAKYQAEFDKQIGQGLEKRAAIAAVIERYGPVNQPSVPTVDTKGALSVDKQDFVWVYHNIKATGVTPQSAPSYGAFALWELTQSNDGLKLFYQVYLPKIMKDELDHKDDKFADDDRPLYDICDKLLRIKQTASGVAYEQEERPRDTNPDTGHDG